MKVVQRNTPSSDAWQGGIAAVGGFVVAMLAGVFMPPLGALLALLALGVLAVYWKRQGLPSKLAAASAGVVAAALVYGALVVVNQIAGDPGTGSGSSAVDQTD